MHPLIDWLVGAWVWANDSLNGAIDWLFVTVQSVDPAWRFVIVALGMFCETSILIGVLVPGDTIVLLASTAVHSWWEGVVLLVAVVLGALGGESVGFLLGRHFGPALRASRLGRRLGERNWERAEYYVARRGGIAIFISRFLPVLHALVPVTVGTSPMRYRTFLAWTAPACLVWATIYVSVGVTVGSGYRQFVEQFHFAGWIVIGAALVIVVAGVLVRRAVHRREERHMQQAEHPEA
jgi:membrane-associated protein